MDQNRAENMLKMSRNLFKMAIKKLTDNPRKNTCIIFNVHSKKKLFFLQKKCTIKLSESYVNAHPQKGEVFDSFNPRCEILVSNS